jgi:cephalosporin-C deacetylase-like acetyl esterase
LAPAAWGQSPPNIAALNRFPRMMQEFFEARLAEFERQNLERLEAVQSLDDAEAYVQQVQSKIRESFGAFPEKTPLEAKVTNVVQRDAYHIENVIFYSRPEFPVTANLYVPKGRKFPLPGVVGTCGHSHNGKAAETYQAFAQGLARQGYVVLIFDPVGQGERFQYTDDDLKSHVGAGVAEHLLAGNQQFLVGEFLGAWRAWDGIRALDYLLSRDEVDPNHVGVTGNSGGGTMTTWLCGVEQRWTMAAPSCFVTTFRRNLENELPADTEQCPPRALALGLDHADFLAALAPKPIIIMAQEKDYFDARGAEEAYRRLKGLYRHFGAEDQLALHIGGDYHGYSKENREAMYRFFNRITGVSDVDSEPAITLEKDETLWCTPRGQVAEMKPRTIYSFTRQAAQDVEESRRALVGEELASAVRDVLKLPRRGPVKDFRILRPWSSRRYPRAHAATYALQTEDNIEALIYRLSDQPWYSRPPIGRGQAILYVSHHSADAELREDSFVKELLDASPQAEFFACDMRGAGESRPNTCGSNTYLQPYGCDYFYAIHGFMLDRPYVGQRVHDLLCVLDLLKSYGHTPVHLAAKGWGAIPATFAALLSSHVGQITLKHAPTSYSEIAQAEAYEWPLSSFLPSVLQKFDLPDCYAALKSKNLRSIEPWGAMADKG